MGMGEKQKLLFSRPTNKYKRNSGITKSSPYAKRWYVIVLQGIGHLYSLEVSLHKLLINYRGNVVTLY